MEGHVASECMRLRGMGPSNMAPPLVGPMGGVAQVFFVAPFHGLVQYHVFPNNQGSHSAKYCEICISHGHSPILQK